MLLLEEPCLTTRFPTKIEIPLMDDGTELDFSSSDDEDITVLITRDVGSLHENFRCVSPK